MRVQEVQRWHSRCQGTSKLAIIMDAKGIEKDAVCRGRGAFNLPPLSTGEQNRFLG